MNPGLQSKKHIRTSSSPPPSTKKPCLESSKNHLPKQYLNREQIQHIANQALDRLQQVLQSGSSMDLRIWKEQNKSVFKEPHVNALSQIQLIRFGALTHVACKQNQEYYDWIRGHSPNIRDLYGIFSSNQTPQEVVKRISAIPRISEEDKLTTIAYYINVNKIPLTGYMDLFSHTEWLVIAKNLRYVNLAGVRNKDQCEHIIKNCKSIVYLKINSPFIKQIPELPDCEEFDCENSISLIQLPLLPKCRIFKCNGCSLLQAIPTLPNGTIIRCSLCPKLKKIGDQPECIELICNGCPQLNQFGNLPKCEHLNCSECISLEVLPPLENCKRLTCPSCTYLRLIPKLPSCFHLDCRFCPSIKKLEGLDDCEILEAAHCVNLCDLPRLKKCKELFISSCINLSRLPILPACRTLDIRNTPISLSQLSLDASCFIQYERDYFLPNCRSMARIYIGNPKSVPIQFEVEVSSITENPVKVLERLGALYLLPSGLLPNVVFTKNGQYLSGLDYGGIKRDFITQLLKELFKENSADERYLVVEDGIPSARGGEFERDTYFALGKLMALCYFGSYYLCLGDLFSDKFYECLAVKGNTEVTSKRWYLNCYLTLIGAPSESYRLFDFNFPYEELSQNEFDNIHYYIDPLQEFDLSLEKLRCKSTRLFLYEKLVAAAKENGRVNAISYIAKSMAETINRWRWYVLRDLTPSRLRQRIQGVLSAKELLKRLIYTDSSTGTLEERLKTKGFVTNWINNADKDNLELFVEAVTGSKMLVENSFINIRFVDVKDKLKDANHYPIAHTCSAVLELPVIYLHEKHFSDMLNAIFLQINVNERFQLN